MSRLIQFWQARGSAVFLGQRFCIRRAGNRRKAEFEPQAEGIVTNYSTNRALLIHTCTKNHIALESDGTVDPMSKKMNDYQYVLDCIIFDDLILSPIRFP